jgi:hypothetical protein
VTFRRDDDVVPATQAVVGRDLSRDECLALLATARVGRVAASIDALPTIHAVAFVLSHNHIVFRVDRASDLARALVGAVVAFEADGCEPTTRARWSVLVRGVVVDAERALAPALSRPDGPGEHALELSCTLISGRREPAFEPDRG